MRRLLGFAALSLAVAAFSGTAIGLPGGDRTTRCSSRRASSGSTSCAASASRTVRVGLHNTTDRPAVRGPVLPSRPGPCRCRARSSRATRRSARTRRRAGAGHRAAGRRARRLRARLRLGAQAAGLDAGLGRLRPGAAVRAGGADEGDGVQPPGATTSRRGPSTATRHALALGGADSCRRRSRSTSAGPTTSARCATSRASTASSTATSPPTRWPSSTDGTTFTNVRTSTWGASEVMKTARLTTPGAQRPQAPLHGHRRPQQPRRRGGVHPARRAGRRAADVSATALSVPKDLSSRASRSRCRVSAGNWTNDPLEVEASVDVPEGWTAAAGARGDPARRRDARSR